ncbi:MAG: host-nuclease inhibitor Gam family protein [Azonexus sp.]
MTTITEIRAAAQRLADAHRESVSRATALENELNKAVTPIYAAHRTGLDTAAEEEASAKADLQALVDAAPQLFSRPRSILVDGVKCGYRKGEDQLDWDDDATVINRIRALALDEESVIIRTEESINVAALVALDGNDLRRIGVRRIPGIDQNFISFTDTDVEKLVKAILADTAKRQDSDDAPKKAKGKAKIKEAA